MQLTGTELLSCIRNTLQRANANLAQQTAAQAAVAMETETLIQREAALFTALASLDLPELSQSHILSLNPELQPKLEKLFSQFQEERASLQSTVEALNSSEADLLLKLSQTNESLATLAGQRDALEDQADALLSRNESYQREKTQTQNVAAQIARDKARLDELLDQKSIKSAGYERDPVFAYLLSRGFHKKSYHASLLFKKIDTLAADYIDFEAQYRNYSYIQSIPDLVSIEVEKKEAVLEGQLATLEVTEKTVYQQIGLDEVLTQGELQGRQREQIQNDLQTLRQSLAQNQERLNALEQNANQYYLEALRFVSTFLRAQDVEQLLESVRRTLSVEDDQLLAQIREVQSQLEEQKAKKADISRSLEESLARRNELLKVQQRFTQKGFDSPNTSFVSNTDLSSLPGKLLLGTLQASAVWRQIVGAYQKPTRVPRQVFDQDEILDVIERQFGRHGRRSRRPSVADHTSRMGTVFGSRKKGGSFSSGSGF